MVVGGEGALDGVPELVLHLGIVDRSDDVLLRSKVPRLLLPLPLPLPLPLHFNFPLPALLLPPHIILIRPIQLLIINPAPLIPDTRLRELLLVYPLYDLPIERRPHPFPLHLLLRLQQKGVGLRWLLFLLLSGWFVFDVVSETHRETVLGVVRFGALVTRARLHLFLRHKMLLLYCYCS